MKQRTQPRRLNRAEKREANRARILQAARRVFGERGFHAASIEEIADEAGLSVPKTPVFFSKPASALVAHGHDVHLLSVGGSAGLPEWTAADRSIAEGRRRLANRLVVGMITVAIVVFGVLAAFSLRQELLHHQAHGRGCCRGKRPCVDGELLDIDPLGAGHANCWKVVGELDEGPHRCEGAIEAGIGIAGAPESDARTIWFD